MRKSDLINRISEKTGIPRIDVIVSIETFLREIKDSLRDGENVYVRGFGSFVIKKRAAKVGRNIKKNVEVNIPESIVPSFKPAKTFVDKIKKSKSAPVPETKGAR